MKNPIIKKFLIRAGLLYFGWLVLYYGIILPDGRINKFLTDMVVEGTVIGLNLLGHDTSGVDSIIAVDSQPVVLVEDGCNGLELFVLFAGFILAFPGKILYKSIIIPIGIFIIFLFNVFREITLALNYMFFKETFEFNHKYTYVFVIYLIVFAIWRFWLKRFSYLANANQ